MKHMKKAMLGALALAMAFAMCFAASPASAYYSPSTGEVWLYNNGSATMNATTDWRFHVDIPQDLNIEQDYWNFTVYGSLVDNTGAAANGTYVVTIYLDDGIINRSATSSLSMVNDVATPVYGNISFPASTIALFEENSTATITVVLSLSAVAKDTYSSQISIAADAIGGSLNSMVPLIVSMFILVMIISMMGGLFDGMGNMFKGAKSGSKKKKAGKK